jgi:hypothetical protein
MLARSFSRALVATALLGIFPSATRADEIVHFTNGAEMTVRSHSVDKEMVKLDLGGNSFISFPMSMVDKIVSAGKDVFLNPTFHPANQAVAGSPSGPNPASRNPGAVVAATGSGIRGGGGGSVGFVPQNGVAGAAGVRLGEASDLVPQQLNGGGNGLEGSVAARNRRFDPAHPVTPGSGPQIIGAPTARPVRMALVRPQAPAEPPPNPGGTQGGTPEGDPPPVDPPDTP